MFCSWDMHFFVFLTISKSSKPVTPWWVLAQWDRYFWAVQRDLRIHSDGSGEGGFYKFSWYLLKGISSYFTKWRRTIGISKDTAFF